MRRFCILAWLLRGAKLVSGVGATQSVPCIVIFLQCDLAEAKRIAPLDICYCFPFLQNFRPAPGAFLCARPRLPETALLAERVAPRRLRARPAATGAPFETLDGALGPALTFLFICPIMPVQLPSGSRLPHLWSAGSTSWYLRVGVGSGTPESALRCFAFCSLFPPPPPHLVKPGVTLLTHHTKDSLETRVTSISVVRMCACPSFLLELIAIRHSEHGSRSDSRSNLFCRLSFV